MNKITTSNKGKEVNNLYKIELYGRSWPDFYAIATDPTAAHDKVKKYLEENDIGLSQDRAMSRIELLASCSYYGGESVNTLFT